MKEKSRDMLWHSEREKNIEGRGSGEGKLLFIEDWQLKNGEGMTELEKKKYHFVSPQRKNRLKRRSTSDVKTTDWKDWGRDYSHIAKYHPQIAKKKNVTTQERDGHLD